MTEQAFFPDHVGKKKFKKEKTDVIVSIPDVGGESVPTHAHVVKEIKDEKSNMVRTEKKPTTKDTEVKITTSDVRVLCNCKEPVILKVKKMHEDAVLPKKKSAGAAAFDLFALEDAIVTGGSVTKVRTGISIEAPQGYKGEIYSRSGLAAKQGIFVINQPGKIDSDYRGEIFIILGMVGQSRLFGDIPLPHYEIKKGDRIAQLELQEVVPTIVVEANSLSETKRGIGGMGSTGK